MKHNRLLKKFLAFFFGLVLLPFMVLVAGLLLRANGLQLKNDLAQNENLTLQTVNAVRRQNELAENMCKTVAQNQNLINFLDKEYETTPDLSYYRTTIWDFVKMTNGVSNVKLRIYMENESIPMGFGIFYHMSSLNFSPQLEEYYHSDKGMMWIRDTKENAISKLYERNPSNGYHYLYKIQVASRCIAIIDAVVPENAYNLNDPLSNAALEPIELDQCRVYNYSGKEIPTQQLEEFAATGSGRTRNLVYSRTEMPAGPFDVLVITERSQVTRPHLWLLAFIPISFAVMLAGFFVYNRRAIQDIHTCLDDMEMAIENNFELPEEVENAHIERALQRNDEIAVLASRTNYLLKQIRTLLAREVQQQTAAKEAQLLALQHQINPHFLYNTMEVFSSRMELAGLYEESGAISAFCRMLRYNMNTKELMATLADEVQQVKYYLAIQKIRNIPFEVDFDIPDELQQEKTIRFLLEPFVENSFKYRGGACPLKVQIIAREKGEDMEIVIRNNGELLSPERVAELNQRFRQAPASVRTQGEHIGLTNINSRLKLFYGEDHFIRVESEDGETVFRFVLERRLPVKEPPQLP